MNDAWVLKLRIDSNIQNTFSCPIFRSNVNCPLVAVSWLVEPHRGGVHVAQGEVNCCMICKNKNIKILNALILGRAWHGPPTPSHRCFYPKIFATKLFRFNFCLSILDVCFVGWWNGVQVCCEIPGTLVRSNEGLADMLRKAYFIVEDCILH